MWRDLLDDRQERQIEEQAAVFGVIGDPRDLLGRKPRVDRVQDSALAGDGVIELHVAVAVPRESGNAIRHADAQRVQRIGELLGAYVKLAIRVAMNVALHPPRHDLNVAVMPVRVANKRRDQQRNILHQTKHELPPYGFELRIASGTRKLHEIRHRNTLDVAMRFQPLQHRPPILDRIDVSFGVEELERPIDDDEHLRVAIGLALEAVPRPRGLVDEVAGSCYPVVLEVAPAASDRVQHDAAAMIVRA